MVIFQVPLSLWSNCMLSPGHFPNGVQGIGNGLQQIMGGGGGGGGEGGAGGETIIPMDTVEHKPRPSIPDHAHQQSTSVVGTESSRDGYIRHANTLSRDDQDTYLQAHFANSSSVPYSRDQEDTPPLSQYHQSMGEGTSATPSHAPNTIISTRTQISTSSHHVANATPLSRGHTPILEYPNHPPSGGTGLSQPADPTLSPHEITQVTNSVHAPISSLTPLPNDSSDAYSGCVANITPYKKDFSRSDV